MKKSEKRMQNIGSRRFTEKVNRMERMFSKQRMQVRQDDDG